VTASALFGATFACTQTAVAEAAAQPKMNKHQTVQVVDCMRKRMAASRGSSFNEVRKVCKDEVAVESENASTTPMVASATLTQP
jgi:hypothetical protein